MNQPTLVIMAAGMGSRFGGNKQITPVDDMGQVILDYSVYDAHRAGFENVVCVIKHDFAEDFHRRIGSRMAGKVNLTYAYQELDMLPAGFPSRKAE